MPRQNLFINRNPKLLITQNPQNYNAGNNVLIVIQF